MREDVRDTMIAVAENLLRAGRRTGEITVREIAREAGVSPGLVNYHFGSKDALLATAATRIFEDFAPRWADVTGPDGIGALKKLLKDIAGMVALVGEGSESLIRHELMNGGMDTVKFLVPVLKGILPPGTRERDIRAAAFFIVVPLQVLYLRKDEYAAWAGCSLDTRAEQDELVDFVVDRILGPYEQEHT